MSQMCCHQQVKYGLLKGLYAFAGNLCWASSSTICTTQVPPTVRVAGWPQVRERAAAAVAADSTDGSAGGQGIAQLFGQAGSRPGTSSSSRTSNSSATPMRPALDNYIVSR
jgi:hypothetical protein